LHREAAGRLLKPIYLLADSRPLFWNKDDVPFLSSLVVPRESGTTTAAYLGASNGDNPEYYSLFRASMQGVGVEDCKMILSSFPAEDAAFVERADIILLAGGDVSRGWEVFRRTGLNQVLVRRYLEGATLIGVSAGAVQLGLYGWRGDVPSDGALFDTLGLAPFMVGAHEEGSGWAPLRTAMSLAAGDLQGLGIPAGAGVVCHPEGRLEPLRRPVYQFSKSDGRLTQSVLLPEAGGEGHRKG
jgi:cyanophycinase